MDLNSFASTVLLPLFIRGKLGTRRLDCGDKIWKEPCLFIFSRKKQTITASCLASFRNFDRFSKLSSGSALLRYAIITSVQKLTWVIKSNAAGFLKIQRQQENTKENTKLKRQLKYTGIKVAFLQSIGQKGFPD